MVQGVTGGGRKECCGVRSARPDGRGVVARAAGRNVTDDESVAARIDLIFFCAARASISTLPRCRHLCRWPPDRMPVVLMPASCLVQGSLSAGDRCGCSLDRSSDRCAPSPPCADWWCAGAADRCVAARAAVRPLPYGRPRRRLPPRRGARTWCVKIAMLVPADLTVSVRIGSLMRPNTNDEAIARAVPGVGTRYVGPRGQCPKLGV